MAHRLREMHTLRDAHGGAVDKRICVRASRARPPPRDADFALASARDEVENEQKRSKRNGAAQDSQAIE